MNIKIIGRRTSIRSCTSKIACSAKKKMRNRYVQVRSLEKKLKFEPRHNNATLLIIAIKPKILRMINPGLSIAHAKILITSWI
jgi:hypothetical protein